MASVDDQLAQVNRNLTTHPIKNNDDVMVVENLREAAIELGAHIVEGVPDSREKSLALTDLEQAVMWAVAGIARHQEGS